MNQNATRLTALKMIKRGEKMVRDNQPTFAEEI